MRSLANKIGTLLATNGFWVLPKYRSKGAGQAIFDYLTPIWDRLNLEVCGEATVFSATLAKRHGFITIGKHVPKFPEYRQHDLADGSERRHRKETKDGISESEWNRIVQDVQANPLTIFWRPKYSEREKYLDRDDQGTFPWEIQPRLNKLWTFRKSSIVTVINMIYSSPLSPLIFRASVSAVCSSKYQETTLATICPNLLSPACPGNCLQLSLRLEEKYHPRPVDSWQVDCFFWRS